MKYINTTYDTMLSLVAVMSYCFYVDIMLPLCCHRVVIVSLRCDGDIMSLTAVRSQQTAGPDAKSAV